MRVLLILLSDIHIKSGRESILERAEYIANAVQNLDRSLDAAVIAVCGDLAFSGQVDQYTAVWSFLDELSSELSRKLGGRLGNSPITPTILAVPGNHDCDFSVPDEVRSMVIEGIIKEPEKLAQSIYETCLVPQNHFFSALSAFGSIGSLTPLSDVDPRIAYTHVISAGDHSVRFLCLNTAWLSRRHEDQGALLMPEAVIEEHGYSEDVVVAMLHHPYAWHEANLGRRVRRRLENVADLVLTGHEHDPGLTDIRTSDRSISTHIENGALFDASNPEESHFFAFVLDVENKKQKTLKYSWNGELYASAGARSLQDENSGRGWDDFYLNRIRKRGAFHLSDQTEQWLEDPGVPLAHPTHGKVRLGDIFVYPDLQDGVEPEERNRPSIRGMQIEELVRDTQRVHIVGDAQSGKTTLAKRLFGYLHSIGYVPLYIEGRHTLPSPEEVLEFLAARSTEQYFGVDREGYRQLDPARRVLIIDDFHLILKDGSKYVQKEALLDQIHRFVGKTILVGNLTSLSSHLLYEAGPRRSEQAQEALYSQFRIMEFGFALRHQLAERWLALDGQVADDEREVALRHKEITDQLTSLVGQNWLPSYPPYILAVLQGSVTPVDSRISAYGAYYELFIMNALAQKRNAVEFSGVSTYLSFLAFRLFEGGFEEMDAVRHREVHQEYEAEYGLRVDIRPLIRNLKECGILADDDSVVRFRYRFVYYYFTAAWIRDHLSETDYQQQTRRLVQELYNEDYSSIILFLTHLTRDPLVVDMILEQAGSLFEDYTPAQLDIDVDWIYDATPPANRINYREVDTISNRRQAAESLDNAFRDFRSPASSAEGLPSDFNEASWQQIRELLQALQVVHTLGQVLRNFPGSIVQGRKFEIAEASSLISRRILGKMLENARQTEDERVERLMAALKEAEGGLTDAAARTRARELFAEEVFSVAYLVMILAATGIAAPQMDQTYRALQEHHDSPFTRIQLMIGRLSAAGTFSRSAISEADRALRNNQVARRMLATAVTAYFRMFPVPYDTRQAVCSELGISFSRLPGTSNPRMIPPPQPPNAAGS